MFHYLMLLGFALIVAAIVLVFGWKGLIAALLLLAAWVIISIAIASEQR